MSNKNSITSNLYFCQTFFFTRKILFKNPQKPIATLIYTNNIQYIHFIHLTTNYKYILLCKNTLMFRKCMHIKVANDESSSTYVR